MSSRTTASPGCSEAVSGKRWFSSGVSGVSLGPDKRAAVSVCVWSPSALSGLRTLPASTCSLTALGPAFPQSWGKAPWRQIKTALMQRRRPRRFQEQRCCRSRGQHQCPTSAEGLSGSEDSVKALAGSEDSANALAVSQLSADVHISSQVSADVHGGSEVSADNYASLELSLRLL